ncbi:Mini-ribonuclease 3 [Acaryochloris thomasi]|nr:ribonuclease III domain-containing protein [Acaryochloris thomasi]
MVHNQPPRSAGEVEKLSPSAWAYIGDAVYELFVRTQYLYPPSRLQAYHQRVVSHVCAESQAQVMNLLSEYLMPSEIDIVRRGRNAASGKPKRIKLGTYQQATGLEALLGYLYLTDPQRLDKVLTHIRNVSQMNVTPLTNSSSEERV